MEDIVSSCLKDLIHRNKIVDCDEKSFYDIMAITLNQLPSKYVVSLQGEVFAKTQLKSQIETDVYRELSYAIEKVMNLNRKSVLFTE